MRAYRFSHLGNRDLLRTLDLHVAKGRINTAVVLALIAEVDERRLYVSEGYSSMHAYCVGKLGFSEDAADRRIQAARVARKFPAIFPALAEGQLHLTAVNLLASYLTSGNAGELIGLATRKTRAEIEQLLAARFPKTESIPLVLAIPAVTTNESPALARVETDRPETIQVLAGQPTPDKVRSDAPRARVAPIAADRYALQFSIGGIAHDKLRYAQELLSHSIPSGDLAQVFERALDALIAQLAKRKFAAADKPRPGRASSNPRHIPAHVRRAVWKRDGGRCTFVSENGHRCESRRFLEFDHIDPVARGGTATVESIRLRCRAHNQYEADRTFGPEFMNGKREQARRAREANRAATETRAAAVANAEAVEVPAAKAEAQSQAAAAEQRAKDVQAGLRQLGFRADQARRAAEFSATLPDQTLEDQVRAALRFLCPKTRSRIQVGTTPGVPT